MRYKGGEVSEGLLTIEDITLGQWAGQVLVCDAGYEIRGDLRPFPPNVTLSGPWIVPCGQEGRWELVMSRRAPEDLHRRFARLSRGRDTLSSGRILAFARRWGLLGDSAPDDDRRTRHGLMRADGTEWFGEGSPAIMTGERLMTWWLRSDMVAAWVQWWSLIASGSDRLRAHIMWDPATESLRYYFGFDGRRLTLDPSFHQRYRTVTWSDGKGCDQWDTIADGRERRGQVTYHLHPELRGPQFDVSRAARFVLYRQIESQLAGNVRVGLDMQREPARAFIVYPASLWGAIWLHFAREVMGRSAALQPCANPHCDQGFSPRPNQKYCSPRCKVAVFRSRQYVAKQ
jgi:hypothetical protein